MELTFGQTGFGWRPQFDNPNFAGWSVVAFYELAALACARAAVVAHFRKSADCVGMWPGLALALCFLGVNKQLNLQTLLIVLGRHWAAAAGWSGQRRAMQLAFAVVFALGLVVLLLWLKTRHGPFFQRHRAILWGLLILAFFVALRSSTINHANQLLGLGSNDKEWAWALEIAGSTLIGMGAIHASLSSSS
jgi:hypothetical protein